MSLTIWCDKCARRFSVSEFDPDTRLCTECGGVEPLLYFPLTEEERGSTIVLKVRLYNEVRITRDDVKTDADWRNLLNALESWDGKSPDPLDTWIEDASFGAEVVDVDSRVKPGKPRPVEQVAVSGGLL